MRDYEVSWKDAEAFLKDLNREDVAVQHKVTTPKDNYFGERKTLADWPSTTAPEFMMGADPIQSIRNAVRACRTVDDLRLSIAEVEARFNGVTPQQITHALRYSKVSPLIDKGTVWRVADTMKLLGRQ